MAEELMEQWEVEQLEFLSQLKNVDIRYYCYQDEIMKFSPFYKQTSPAALHLFHKQVALYKERVPIQGRGLGNVKHYTYPELQFLTDNFNEKNLIQRTRYGRLFRARRWDGDEERQVTIKTWDTFYPLKRASMHCADKIYIELVLFTDEKIKSHPSLTINTMEKVLKLHKNLVKVTGFSCDKSLAVIYDLRAVQSVGAAIPSGSFDWNARIIVAMEIAQLVKLVHDQEFAVGTINANNIMIDEEGNFKLFELGLHVIVGGKPVEDVSDFFYGSYARFAPEFMSGGEFNIKSDVYTYGILLLELISKWLFDEKDPDELIMWMRNQYRNGSPIVDTSFEVDGEIEAEMAGLILSCLQESPSKRPDMTKILGVLEKHYGDLPHKVVKKQKGKETELKG